MEPFARSPASAGCAASAPMRPFVLTRWTGGRLTLDDSSTGAHVELGGFGPDNQVAFAGLLAAR